MSPAEEINFRCPHCNIKLKANAALVGSELECLDCGKTLIVPQPDSTPAPELRKTDGMRAKVENVYGVVSLCCAVTSWFFCYYYRPDNRIAVVGFIIAGIVVGFLGLLLGIASLIAPHLTSARFSIAGLIGLLFCLYLVFSMMGNM